MFNQHRYVHIWFKGVKMLKPFIRTSTDKLSVITSYNSLL